MADLGAIASYMDELCAHPGGVITGTVTAANGSPAADRILYYMNRTVFNTAANFTTAPVWNVTATDPSGVYFIPGADAAQPGGAHRYAVVALEDTVTSNLLGYDHVVPS